MSRPSLSAAALVLALLPWAGCSDDGDTTITVLAASSLTETFEELADRFEEAHPGVRVRLAFESSATLAQQAVEGAPADVLATADEATMAGADDALAADPEVFAANSLVLVTPAGNPAGVGTIDDLDRDGVRWVACVETAPCGKAARAVLEEHGVTGEPASLEIDVKAVLARVTSDEADAGFVYRTDAIAAGPAVRAIRVSTEEVPASLYPIAPLAQSEHPDLARAFVDLVLSEDGQQVLTEAGFLMAFTAQAS